LLRWALLADAIGTGASVVLVLAAAEWLSPHLGLPVELLRGAGLVLIPFVAMLVAAASRLRPAWLVGLVIGLNLVWAVASIALIVGGIVQPTTLGIVVVIGQAAAVLGIAVLQYVGLQRTDDH
jgi:hypothetical protein